MDREQLGEVVADVLRGMSKGQYLLLATAIQDLGGELRVDWEPFTRALADPMPPIIVDATDGPVVLRVGAVVDENRIEHL